MGTADEDIGKDGPTPDGDKLVREVMSYLWEEYGSGNRKGWQSIPVASEPAVVGAVVLAPQQSADARAVAGEPAVEGVKGRTRWPPASPVHQPAQTGQPVSLAQTVHPHRDAAVGADPVQGGVYLVGGEAVICRRRNPSPRCPRLRWLPGDDGEATALPGCISGTRRRTTGDTAPSLTLQLPPGVVLLSFHSLL